MVYVERNNQRFGPYDDANLVKYVNSGQILLCDSIFDDVSGRVLPVRKYLKGKNLRTNIQHDGSIFQQLKKIGTELLLPKDAFRKSNIISDYRLLI